MTCHKMFSTTLLLLPLLLGLSHGYEVDLTIIDTAVNVGQIVGYGVRTNISQNFSCALDYGDNSCSTVFTNECLSYGIFNASNSVPIFLSNYSYSSFGVFNVTVQCSTDIWFYVDYQGIVVEEPLENLTIGYPSSNYFQLVSGVEFASAQFTYQNGSNVNVSCDGHDVNCTCTTAIDPYNRIGNITTVCSPPLIHAYNFTITLWNNRSTISENGSFVPLGKVQGLQLYGDDVFLVGERAYFHTTVTSAPLANYLWLTSNQSDETIWISCESENSTGNFSHVFVEIGEATVEVEVKNALNSESVSKTVRIVAHVELFSLVIVPEPTPGADLILKTSSKNLMHMGNLSVGITNDGTPFLDTSITPIISGQNFTIFTNLSQGDYQLNVSVYSNWSADVFTESFAVWRQIYLTSYTEHNVLKVNETFQIEFLNSSGWGNAYTIDYGDDSDIQYVNEWNEYRENNFLLNHFYSNEGQYKFKVNVTNKLYFQYFELNFTVLHEVPEFNLTIPSEILVFRPLSYSFHYLAPKPTLAHCNITFGNSEVSVVEHFTWEELETKNELKAPTWSTVYNVTVFCANSISSKLKQYHLEVLDIYPEDFNISYHILVGFNDTDNEVEVIFHIQYFDNSFIPPNITLKLDFDDGSPSLLKPLQTWSISYLFKQRGLFNGTLAITFLSRTPHIHHLPIRVGILNVEINSTDALTSRDVTIVIGGAAGDTVSYRIDFGDGIVEACTESNVNEMFFLRKKHAYREPGVYEPHVLVSSNLFVEEQSLDPIHIQWSLDELELEVDQNISPTSRIGRVGLSADNSVFFQESVSCILSYSDSNDLDVITEIPTYIEHTFAINGEVEVTAVCNNSAVIRTLTNSTIIPGICLESIQPFSHYGDRLVKFVSESLTLTATVNVLCSNMTTVFTWNIYQNDIIVKTEQTNLAVLTVTPRTFLSGTYQINFRASFLEEQSMFVLDSIEVEYKMSPLFAGITGGSLRKVGSQQTIQLDAAQLSYDPDAIQPGPQGLTYSWKCYKTSDPEEAQQAFALGKPFTQCPSCVLNIGPGLQKVSPGCLEVNIYHVVLVTVSKDERIASAFQILDVELEPTALIAIRCKSNCLQRKNAEEEIKLISSCEDCSLKENNEAAYKWTLFRRLSTDDSEEVVPEFEDMTTTGVRIATMSIVPNTLETGYLYRLEVRVNNVTGKSEGVSSEVFHMNYPPYGGACTVTPERGLATLDKFYIRCSGWRDEGMNVKRSPGDSDLRLRYQAFRTKNNKLNLIYGGESRESPGFVLDLGDPDDDYQVLITARIFDGFNGMAEETITIRVVSPFDTPSGDIQATNVSTVLDKLNSGLEQAVLNGDVQLGYQSVSSAASVIQTIVLPKDDSILPKSPDNWVDEQPVDIAEGNGTALPWTELWDDLLTPPDTSTKDRLTKTISGYTDALADLVNKTEVITVDTLWQVSDSITTLMEEPQYVDPEARYSALNSFTKVTDSLDDLLTESKTYKTPEVVTSLVSVLNMMVVLPEPFTGPSNPSSDVLSIAANSDKELSYLPDESLAANLRAKEQADVHDDERAFFMSRAYLEQKYNNDNEKKMAKNTIQSVEDILDKALMVSAKGMVVGEEAVDFTNSKLSASVEKLGARDIFKRTTEVFGASIGFDTIPDIGLQNPTIVIKATLFAGKPFVSTDPSDDTQITSSSLSLNFTAENEEDHHIFSGSMKDKYKQTIRLPNPRPVETITLTPQYIPEDRDQLLYMKTELASIQDSIVLFLDSDIPYVKYDVYFRSGEFPTSMDYHYKTNIPPTRTFPGQKLKVICPERALPSKGTVYIGFRPFDLDEPIQEKRRSKRSPSNATIYSDMDIGIATVGCKVWDKVDSKWTTDTCTVSIESTENHTVCKCETAIQEPFTLATSFVVPVNKIDFSTVFTKIDLTNNASVLATILSILLAYALLAVWARYKDSSDFLKWGITPLLDNNPDHTYIYLVTVTTAMRPGAGTKSRVGLVLSGEEGDTHNRLLYDGIREEFPAGSVLNFLLLVPYGLGEIHYIRLWHDDSGSGDNASWLLKDIVLEDIQTDTKYTFLCDRWLAVDKDDGKIDRILPVSGKADLESFSHQFSDNIRTNVTDSHIWLSVAMRPKQSHYTRFQRLSCCLSLLFLTMITSAMFYGAKENIVRPTLVSVGPLRFSLQELYVSFISILIVTPVNMIMVLLFKKTIPKANQKQADKKHCSSCLKGRGKNKELTEIMIAKRTYDVNERMLPHFCIYITWGLLIVSVAASSFFLFLYSQEWGKVKSEEWLSSFVLSFVESLFFMDPIKVFVLTVGLSLLLRKSDKGDSQVDKGKLDRKKQYQVDDKDMVRHSATPLEEPEVRKSREIRKTETTAFGIVKEIIFYVVFLMVLFTIGYSNRDSRSFAMRDNVFNMLIRKQNDKRMGLQNIRSREHFFRWMNQTAFPALFSEHHYEGTRKHWRDRYYVKDLQNYRVGPPRMRQLRVGPGRNCSDSRLGAQTCHDAYSILGEEDESFCVGWKPLPCPAREPLDTFTTPAWTFTSSLKVWGLPVWGHYNTYNGGGYISQLEVNYQVSLVMLNEEFSNLWLDLSTRAVSLEFTLYNPNVNMFVYAILLVEFPETGGAIPSAYVSPFRGYHHVGAMGTYLIFNEVIFVLLLLISTVKMFLLVKKERLAFFKDLWNTTDFLCILTCYTCLAMFVMKELMVQSALKRFRENPKQFVNFQHITMWDDIMVSLTGLVCFFSTVRMIKVLGYNTRISSISSVIKRAKKDLSSFSLLFGIVFIGFAILGNLLFGRSLRAYHGLKGTVATLMSSMIGKTPFDEMRRTEPVLAQVYFAFFVFFVVFILLTMFLSILNEAISEIRKDDIKDESRHEVFTILLKKFKQSFGIRTEKADEGKTADGGLPSTDKAQLDSEFALKVLAADLHRYTPLVNAESPPLGPWNNRQLANKL